MARVWAIILLVSVTFARVALLVICVVMAFSIIFLVMASVTTF